MYAVTPTLSLAVKVEIGMLRVLTFAGTVNEVISGASESLLLPVMARVFVAVLEPNELLTVRVTVKLPSAEYVWIGF